MCMKNQTHRDRLKKEFKNQKFKVVKNHTFDMTFITGSHRRKQHQKNNHL